MLRFPKNALWFLFLKYVERSKFLLTRMHNVMCDIYHKKNLHHQEKYHLKLDLFVKILIDTSCFVLHHFSPVYYLINYTSTNILCMILIFINSILFLLHCWFHWRVFIAVILLSTLIIEAVIP